MLFAFVSVLGLEEEEEDGLGGSFLVRLSSRVLNLKMHVEVVGFLVQMGVSLSFEIKRVRDPSWLLFMK